MNELNLNRTPAESATLRLGPQGRLVIPANLRRVLDLQTGTELVARAVDGQLVVETLDNVKRRLRERYQGLTAGSMAEELIAERRQDALRELEREPSS
jgi:bifunctional DNA-binding transcriptional regulator/antitoxin component of YhaV-PrlF toxin-antitoxin module